MSHDDSRAAAPEADFAALSDAQWLQRLGEARFRICRRGGTEPAFSGRYWDCHEPGVYVCAACGARLFDAARKYDSGSGWPSFTAPVDAAALRELPDHSHGMIRVEVRCRRCDSHLGHVFEDGPRASGGLRYCINSASMDLDPPAEA